MRDYNYAEENGIKIRVDFSRPETSVDYKIDNDDWTASPFQSADLNHLDADGVLEEVINWLEGQ